MRIIIRAQLFQKNTLVQNNHLRFHTMTSNRRWCAVKLCNKNHLPLINLLLVQILGLNGFAMGQVQNCDSSKLVWQRTRLNLIFIMNTCRKSISNNRLFVFKWFKANKLSVNASKTNYMLLGTNHKLSRLDESASIILDNTTLKRVNNTKFLGVTIDENLNWTNHIETISKNISRGVGIINKLKHFVPEGVLYSLYCTLILPYINYSIIAWGSSNKSNLDRIMKLQKKAVRIMSNSHYLSHSAPLLKKYNLLNV